MFFCRHLWSFYSGVYLCVGGCIHGVCASCCDTGHLACLITPGEFQFILLLINADVKRRKCSLCSLREKPQPILFTNIQSAYLHFPVSLWYLLSFTSPHDICCDLQRYHITAERVVNLGTDSAHHQSHTRSRMFSKIIWYSQRVLIIPAEVPLTISQYESETSCQEWRKDFHKWSRVVLSVSMCSNVTWAIMLHLCRGT